MASDVGTVTPDSLFEWAVEVPVAKVIPLKSLVNDRPRSAMICRYDGVTSPIGDGSPCGAVVDDGCCAYGASRATDESKWSVSRGDDTPVVVSESRCDDLMAWSFVL